MDSVERLLRLRKLGFGLLEKYAEQIAVQPDLPFTVVGVRSNDQLCEPQLIARERLQTKEGIDGLAEELRAQVESDGIVAVLVVSLGIVGAITAEGYGAGINKSSLVQDQDVIHPYADRGYVKWQQSVMVTIQDVNSVIVLAAPVECNDGKLSLGKVMENTMHQNDFPGPMKLYGGTRKENIQ